MKTKPESKLWIKALRKLKSSRNSNKNAMDIYGASMKLNLIQYIQSIHTCLIIVTLDLQTEILNSLISAMPKKVLSEPGAHFIVYHAQ